MAHIEVNAFLESLIAAYSSCTPSPSVLEIGSYDVNGSVRANFRTAKRYVGVDLIAGPSVDIVCSGDQYRSSEKFDVVLSVESFEHNSAWPETFSNMLAHVGNDGIVIFTCATTGRMEHGTFRTDPLSSPGTASRQNSYYRNLTEKDFRAKFNFDELFSAYAFFTNGITRDLYFYGYKGTAPAMINFLGESFSRAVRSACSARRNISYLNYLKVRAFYLLMSPLYQQLSDEKYQLLTFRPYRAIRRALGLRIS